MEREVGEAKRGKAEGHRAGRKGSGERAHSQRTKMPLSLVSTLETLPRQEVNEAITFICADGVLWGKLYANVMMQ